MSDEHRDLFSSAGQGEHRRKEAVHQSGTLAIDVPRHSIEVRHCEVFVLDMSQCRHGARLSPDVRYGTAEQHHTETTPCFTKNPVFVRTGQAT